MDIVIEINKDIIGIGTINEGFKTSNLQPMKN